MVVNRVLAPKKLENLELLSLLAHLKDLVRVDHPDNRVVILILNESCHPFGHKIEVVNFVVYLVQTLARSSDPGFELGAYPCDIVPVP